MTLIGRDGCHLCDVARGVIDHVLIELPADRADEITVDELSIDDDPELAAQWWEKIPVILIDGRMHAHWRVDAARLRDALAADETAAP